MPVRCYSIEGRSSFKKMKAVMNLILVVTIGLLLFINYADAAGQPTYLGEVCFFLFSEIAGAARDREF